MDKPEGGIDDGGFSGGGSMDASEMEAGPSHDKDSGLADAGDPCADGKKNGKETDTDCGGPKCDPCMGGDNCSANTDCESGTCEADASVCMASTTGDPCPTLTAPEPTCMCFPNMGRGYFFCPGPKDWNAAQTQCMGATLVLASVNDAAEQAFLAMHVTASTWIGAENAGGTSWLWVGTGLEFWNMTAVMGAYANWGPTFPISMPAWCGFMQGMTDKTWATLSCSTPYAYICEQP